MADIYRKSSLEKLSNPEQLDRAITISSPMSWLALIGVALMIAATVLWAVFGTLPTTVKAQGVIVSPDGVGAIYSDQSGTVKTIHVKTGDEIAVGTEIVTIQLSNGTEYALKSDCEGTVSKILVSEKSDDSETESEGQDDAVMQGDKERVYPGTEIIRYTPKLGSSQAVVCFVPLSSSQKYQKGTTKALVSLDSFDSQTYGHMYATVVGVGSYSVPRDKFIYVLGSDSAVAEQFTANGPVVSLICQLDTAETVSGYRWSSKKGADLTVPNGTYVTAQIVVEEPHPIDKLFSYLMDKLEG